MSSCFSCFDPGHVWRLRVLGFETQISGGVGPHCSVYVACEAWLGGLQPLPLHESHCAPHHHSSSFPGPLGGCKPNGRCVVACFPKRSMLLAECCRAIQFLFVMIFCCTMLAPVMSCFAYALCLILYIAWVLSCRSISTSSFNWWSCTMTSWSYMAVALPSAGPCAGLPQRGLLPQRLG